VLPFLPPGHRSTAEALLERVSTVGEQALCHGDLVSEHVLARDGRLSGVIDWGDTRVTDPALDLAWALNATSVAFAEAVAGAADVDDDARARARDWWALEPWSVAARRRAVPPATEGLDDPAPSLRRDLDLVVTRLEWWRDARGPAAPRF